METQSEVTLKKSTAGEYRMKPAIEYEGIASDSREVKPGWLFAAIQGAHNDGAQFIADAIARGAVAILGRPELAPRVRELGANFLADENPRLRLAHLAAAFYGAQPSTIAAVTGTNGKTSVVGFLRQIWAYGGHKAASLGTVGLIAPSGGIPLRHTTPGAIELHRLLARLKRDGVERLALEASSHGLDQFRMDGVDIAAAAFTNLGRDHLDYHASFEAYLEAKLRLLTELVRAGGVAVVNADAAHAGRFISAAQERKLNLLTVGEAGETLKSISLRARGGGQLLRVLHNGKIWDIALPLAGGFQASNALVAAGLALGLGDSEDRTFAALERLEGAPGRLELVVYAPGGAPVYVDYAHTPDALETLLRALRPHAAGKLRVVFGCGGDRDKGKRPSMGAAAARYADAVIVTDDNPRGENPAAIRREALAGCPDAREIGDRAEAIRVAIAALEPGDVLAIAGKGHETGQIVGDETRPFSDREEAIAAAIALGGRAAKDGS